MPIARSNLIVIASAHSEQPLRSDLFNLESLQRHARHLARHHQVGPAKGANDLLPRLSANERVLRDYNQQTLRVERVRRITPAAEWLLDNFHLIEQQIRMGRRHLPRGFSRELPHLIEGPAPHPPRVYDLALELIAHVDGRIDAPHLTSFVAAYEEVAPLKLGELWAIPIMLRLGLIENLRRIAALLGAERVERDRANTWADRILQVAEAAPSQLIIVVAEMAQANLVLTQAFVTEFWRRAQEKSPAFKLALSWIEERLASEGLTIEQSVQNESQTQAADQVSVGNSISSLRFLDAMDWREFVETLSAVEQVLRCDPADVYSDMDFATRDAYRHTVERIARHSSKSELEVAEIAVSLAREHAGQIDPRRGHVGYFLAGRGVSVLERAVGMKVPLRSLLSRRIRQDPLSSYLGGIAVVSLALTFPLLSLLGATGANSWALGVAAVLVLLGASQLAVSLVNWLASVLVQPRLLPRLDFSEGIPPEHRTLVVVPTMLTSVRGIEALLEALEVRHLANRDDNLLFALLTDFTDAAQEHMPGDEDLVRRIRDGTAALNEKYREDRPCIFHLFHRPRRWNAQEGVKVEPYVVAADVYGAPPHTGRGGWTWYTGSAGWMYRLAVETLLGIIREVEQLRFAPRLTQQWKSIKVHYRYRNAQYRISLLSASGKWQGPARVVLDGKDLSGSVLPLRGERADHEVEVHFR